MMSTKGNVNVSGIARVYRRRAGTARAGAAGGVGGGRPELDREAAHACGHPNPAANVAGVGLGETVVVIAEPIVGELGAGLLTHKLGTRCPRIALLFLSLRCIGPGRRGVGAARRSSGGGGNLAAQNTGIVVFRKNKHLKGAIKGAIS